MDTITPEDFLDLFRVVSLRIGERRERLGELDGAIGDADHGISMAKGFDAVIRHMEKGVALGAGVDELLAIASRAFLNAVGATTGPLYAGAFARAAQAFAGRREIADADLVDILAAMAGGIADRGKAVPGDKTMMDAWAPSIRAASAALSRAEGVAASLAAASRAASDGADSTKAMIASKGRAARLGERSLGHVDPGAASAVIVIDAIGEGYAALLRRRGQR